MATRFKYDDNNDQCDRCMIHDGRPIGVGYSGKYGYDGLCDDCLAGLSMTWRQAHDLIFEPRES